MDDILKWILPDHVPLTKVCEIINQCPAVRDFPGTADCLTNDIESLTLSLKRMCDCKWFKPAFYVCKGLFYVFKLGLAYNCSYFI